MIGPPSPIVEQVEDRRVIGRLIILVVKIWWAVGCWIGARLRRNARRRRRHSQQCLQHFGRVDLSRLPGRIICWATEEQTD